MKGRGETEKTIAKELPGRSEDEVAQRWATRSDRWVTVDDPGVIVIDDSPADEKARAAKDAARIAETLLAQREAQKGNAGELLGEPEPEAEPEPEPEPEPEAEPEAEPEPEPEAESESEAEAEPEVEPAIDNDPEEASLRTLAERVRDETGLTLADGWKVVTEIGNGKRRKRYHTPGGKRFGSMSQVVTFFRTQLEDPDVKTIDLSGDGGNNDPEEASPLRDLAERVRVETGLTLADGWKVVTQHSAESGITRRAADASAA